MPSCKPAPAPAAVATRLLAQAPSRSAVLSLLSVTSVASVVSTVSVFSLAALGGVGSVLSGASLLSIGSTLSVLSAGSTFSVLSVGSVGCVGGFFRDCHGERDTAALDAVYLTLIAAGVWLVGMLLAQLACCSLRRFTPRAQPPPPKPPHLRVRELDRRAGRDGSTKCPPAEPV